MDEESAENNSDVAIPKEISVEDQQTRALLRERFLRFISNLSNQTCEINLFENSKQTCMIRACDPSFSNIIVEKLSTNYAQDIEKAIIRMGDIISIQFEIDDLSRYS